MSNSYLAININNNYTGKILPLPPHDYLKSVSRLMFSKGEVG